MYYNRDLATSTRAKYKRVLTAQAETRQAIRMAFNNFTGKPDGTCGNIESCRAAMAEAFAAQGRWMAAAEAYFGTDA
jgi:hypothetical protein